MKPSFCWWNLLKTTIFTCFHHQVMIFPPFSHLFPIFSHHRRLCPHEVPPLPGRPQPPRQPRQRGAPRRRLRRRGAQGAAQLEGGEDQRKRRAVGTDPGSLVVEVSMGFSRTNHPPCYWGTPIESPPNGFVIWYFVLKWIDRGFCLV